MAPGIISNGEAQAALRARWRKQMLAERAAELDKAGPAQREEILHQIECELNNKMLRQRDESGLGTIVH